MIDPEFLAILRCPLHPDGPPLRVQGTYLICGVCGKGYPVIDDIPHLLPEDGVDPDDLPAATNEDGSNE